jgi:hypothetical protein
MLVLHRVRKTTEQMRAERIWGECSLHVRSTLRQRGVVGALPRMDRYVSKDRGAGYARMLADFAQYVMQVSGGRITPMELAKELGEMSADIVMAATNERPGAA